MENKTIAIAGTAGAVHVTDGPLTTSNISEASPALLRSDVDSRIVKIRPMSTPVDQISRWKGARQVNSMQVDYYSVDTKPASASLKSLIRDAEGATFGKKPVYLLDTDNNAIFSASDTVLLPDADASGSPLMLYVVERTATDAPHVIVVGGDDTTDPVVMKDMTVVRMGRAASELDVQTPQFSALPTKDYNYCQIFKTQIEQSLYVKLANKETGWTFTDQEEVAIMDMRMGMEKNFLFGTKARLSNPANYDDVLLTQGIWNQAAGKVMYSPESFCEADLPSIMHAAFTGKAAGSSRKVLIAGGKLVQALSLLGAQRTISATEKQTFWGLDFTEIVSKFGSLYVIYSEVFDQCGHEKDGLIIDPEYITKYVHVPFRVDLIDMHKSGVRNTQALVATEASCLVLRHPDAHLKVIGR